MNKEYADYVLKRTVAVISECRGYDPYNHHGSRMFPQK